MNETVKDLPGRTTGTRYHATVVSTERITPEEADAEVRELVLDVDRSDFPFSVGQSVGILAPGDAAFGHQYHYRLYSVADLPGLSDAGKPRIKLCVRRCSYIDEYSGEEYPGIASHYLCDLRPGDIVTMTGPFGLAFEVPEEMDATLILIGTSTGIAPFRAFVKHLYHNVAEWRGRVWLFYGAHSGLEMLYMNDKRDDFSQYYDEDTFKAFQALSPRPAWGDPIGWEETIAERGEEIWEMLTEPKTYVYVAGLEKMRDELDAVFTTMAGSRKKWDRRKAELMAGKRWVELLY